MNAFFLFALLQSSPFEPLSRDAAAPLLMLRAERVGGHAHATGVVVDLERKHALTTWHSMAGAKAIRAVGRVGDGSLLAVQDAFNKAAAAPVEILYAEPWNDLALLRVEELAKETTAVQPAKADAKADCKLCLHGNPYAKNMVWQRMDGVAGKATDVKWDWPGQRIAAPMLEITAEESPGEGFSGGAVLDADGKLAGLVVAAKGGTVHAVPASELAGFLLRAEIVRNFPVR